MTDHPGRPTARELLHYVGGDAHATHSVAYRLASARGEIRFRCTCGAECVVAALKKYEAALRNVMVVPS